MRRSTPASRPLCCSARLSAGASKQAAREGDADSIHDVRVAMRRLSRCLRVFAPFYPQGSVEKIRRRFPH